MTRSITTTTYNPHLLSREDLIASFIARRPLLDALVDDLRRGAHQHHLLVGARGAGKTTLLLRLAAAIEDDPKLTRRAIPLRFPEEQYNVARPSDFWLNCLDALIDALEARGDQKGKRKLEAAVAAAEQLPEAERSAAALAALTGWAKQAKKLLVLLIDNLDLILQRLRDAQWGLREVLSADNRLVLIGATSTFLEEAVAYESPLYDFFHVHELGPLTESEAREVVAHFAELTGAATIQAALQVEPGRFKALYVLTGGMPRMLTLLTNVLAADASSVDTDLEHMLDQMTPYYKARFDELPEQAQIIVDTVASHWHPITAAACSDRTKLNINLVSAQLNRLVKQGFLAKVSLSDGGKLGFQVRERFFNIWHLMRSSRRARQKLIWLVEFLRMFYGEEELSHQAQVLLDSTPHTDDPAKVLALASTIKDPLLRRRLEVRAATMLAVNVQPDRLREFLDFEGEDAHLTPVLDRVQTLKVLRARATSLPPRLRVIAREIIQSYRLPLKEKVSAIDALQHRKRPPRMHSTMMEDQFFGARLIKAIERGEIPSAPDLTVDDIDTWLTLSTNPASSAVTACTYPAIFNNTNTDDIIHYLLKTSQGGAITGGIAAAMIVFPDDFETSQRRVRLVLQHGTPEPYSAEWSAIMMYFHDCVRSGRAVEAARLLADIGLTDRWLPLYEALRVASGEETRLSHLAPEVSHPAAEILKYFQQSDTTFRANENPPDIALAPRQTRSSSSNPRAKKSS